MSESAVRLTPQAQAYYTQYLGDVDAVGLRVAVEHKGCSGLKYLIEAVKEVPEGHDVLEQSAGWSLYVDQTSLAYLEGLIIDCQSLSLGQQQIVYINPRAQHACGCGESFNVPED